MVQREHSVVWVNHCQDLCCALHCRDETPKKRGKKRGSRRSRGRRRNDDDSSSEDDYEEPVLNDWPKHARAREAGLAVLQPYLDDNFFEGIKWGQLDKEVGKNLNAATTMFPLLK